MTQFLVNLDKSKWQTALIIMAAALILSPFVFHGSATPSYAADEVALPTFGKGPIRVRLYTDYFCAPCRAMEPNIESVLAELVKKDVITLTFIDTPFYQYSSMYVKYFLYAMHVKRDFDTALTARNILIAAATQNIRDTTKLEEALRSKAIVFNAFDTKPILEMYSAVLQADKIEATPSCVIEKGGKKEVYKGGSDVISALEKLRK